jgi:hypothetical protein
LVGNYRKPAPDAYRQAAFVRLRFPEFILRVRNGLLVCRGPVQPTPLSETYKVRVEYRLGGTPNVWVDEPALRRRSATEPIPHTYPENRLCLYLPRTPEWSKYDLIAKTIIPWTSLWLLYYESWLVTGVWQGGGEHPDDGSEERKATTYD